VWFFHFPSQTARSVNNTHSRLVLYFPAAQDKITQLLEFGGREIAGFNLVAAHTFATASQKGERVRERVMKYVPPYE